MHGLSGAVTIYAMRVEFHRGKREEPWLKPQLLLQMDLQLAPLTLLQLATTAASLSIDKGKEKKSQGNDHNVSVRCKNNRKLIMTDVSDIYIVLHLTNITREIISSSVISSS